MFKELTHRSIVGIRSIPFVGDHAEFPRSRFQYAPDHQPVPWVEYKQGAWYPDNVKPQHKNLLRNRY